MMQSGLYFVFKKFDAYIHARSSICVTCICILHGPAGTHCTHSWRYCPPCQCGCAMLQVIATRPNVCKQLHMPAQSGNTSMLERMRRGYTRQAYDDLVAHVRDIVPGVALSTDVITGVLSQHLQCCLPPPAGIHSACCLSCQCNTARTSDAVKHKCVSLL